MIMVIAQNPPQISKERARNGFRKFSENYTQDSLGIPNSRVKIAFSFCARELAFAATRKKKAIKPHDRLVLVG